MVKLDITGEMQRTLAVLMAWDRQRLHLLRCDKRGVLATQSPDLNDIAEGIRFGVAAGVATALGFMADFIQWVTPLGIGDLEASLDGGTTFGPRIQPQSVGISIDAGSPVQVSSGFAWIRANNVRFQLTDGSGNIRCTAYRFNST